MPPSRRNNNKPSKKEIDRTALQFYNSKLRQNPILRAQCSDRHVLDSTIDTWKSEQRLDGLPVAPGASRAAIIYSLRTKWKLIEGMVAGENVIVWKENVASDRVDHCAVGIRANINNDSSMPATGSSKADRIAQTIERIRNSRQEMECNRCGIVIDPITFGGETTQENVLPLGQLSTQIIFICNTSTNDVHCIIKDQVAKQYGIHVYGDKDFILKTNEKMSIRVEHNPKRVGIVKSLLVFEFTSIDYDEYDEYYGEEDDYGGSQLFVITRYITIRAANTVDYSMIKPTSSYVKKRVRKEEKNKFNNPTKAPSGVGGKKKKFRYHLGRYNIPDTLCNMNAVTKEEVMDKMYKKGESNGNSSIRNDEERMADYSSLLTMKNYAQCMSHLLWWEELQMKTDIMSYDIKYALLRRDVNGRYYTLRVPGLAENRPSVLKGDRIVISVHNGLDKFEGIVQRTTNEDAVIEFHPSFNRIFIDGLNVDVRFTFSRTTLRTSHQALMAVNNDKELFSKILFPTMLDMEDNCPLPPLNRRTLRSTQLTFYNRNLNQEQQSAVVGAIQSIARPAPYLIYGPPGTGKTVTLVESILQTIYASGADPNAKILVCAPSNTATDVVVERLAPYVSSREMIRVMAYSREKRSVPESIIKFANYDDASDCFVMPDVDVLKQYKIVAVTVSYGGRLYNNGIQDHFTHVFLDEAGHSIEAEAIACLALVTKHSESDPPVTVLAGDPKQLGPIIRSDIGKKFGLEKSLLERVSERECYARSDECDDLGYYYDRRMITKLVRNYRSHPHILKLPNDEFYDGDLIPAADITRSHRFVAWEHLPRRKFPIVFHGVEGEDMREANSPSWFNPEEVQYVKMYVDLLVMETQQNRCKPEDIGIITPYHKQAQKIRFLLTAHGYDGCKVGSVEEFQGSERPVIIISTVRSTVDHINLDLKHKLGFLANKKRFNVAITRAQALLIMIGNPFTLENDPNWKSMIDYCIEGGGYTGVDYVMMEKRIESTAAVEDIIVGIQSILLNDAASAENDEGDGDFLLVSHVTAQEGPAWKSEE